jgi:spore coat protein SA
VPEKGLHLLIAAMRILSDEGVKARAKIVGSVRFGDNSSSMYAESLRRNCPENVEFLPYMAGQALGEQFRRAAIFCCPSIWDEPFGMVIVEAMASGLPVVASDVGGIPEVLAHGGGMLVKRGSVLELAAAIRSLVESETRRRELGAQALAAFRAHFRWNALHQEYAGLMDSLQQPRPPARALAS